MTGTSAAARCLPDREEQVTQIEEGLDHEQVCAAFEQAIDLLAERGPDGRVVGMAQLARRRAERSDRSGHPRIPTAHVTGLAGNLGCTPVEAACLAGQAEGVEAHPVGAEGQRLDQVRAGIQVFAMERRHEVRPRGRQLVEAGTLGDPPREQERPHATVRQERPVGDARREAGAGEAHGGKPTGSAGRGPVRWLWFVGLARLASLRPGRGQPRRRPSTSDPSVSTRTWGARGLPL